MQTRFPQHRAHFNISGIKIYQIIISWCWTAKCTTIHQTRHDIHYLQFPMNAQIPFSVWSDNIFMNFSLHCIPEHCHLWISRKFLFTIYWKCGSHLIGFSMYMLKIQMNNFPHASETLNNQIICNHLMGKFRIEQSTKYPNNFRSKVFIVGKFAQQIICKFISFKLKMEPQFSVQISNRNCGEKNIGTATLNKYFVITIPNASLICCLTVSNSVKNGKSKRKTAPANLTLTLNIKWFICRFGSASAYLLCAINKKTVTSCDRSNFWQRGSSSYFFVVWYSIHLSWCTHIFRVRTTTTTKKRLKSVLLVYYLFNKCLSTHCKRHIFEIEMGEWGPSEKQPIHAHWKNGSWRACEFAVDFFLLVRLALPHFGK